MDRVEYVKPSFPVDAFAGTAVYYAQYRVPYPKALTDDLLKRTGISGDGKLLDLACGPGRIAIPLASSFRDVWAIDLEPQMIEVGQKESKKRGLANIKWMVGRAEDLEAEPASFQLITIGEAFHRLDQRLIIKRALQWLSPGCCLVTMGCNNILSGTELWQSIVTEIVHKWANRNTARAESSSRLKRGCGPNHDELVLQDAGFEDVANYSFIHPQDWTVESIIGNLYSTSRCSRNVLGDNVRAFETDLKDALIAYDPNGHYRENMRCGYTLGKKPKL